MISKSSVPLITATICVSLLSAICCPSGAADVEAKKSALVRPQCAQHCVHYCCQLLGVPVSMHQVCQLLPPKDKGESMLEITRLLQRVGLDCSGQKASFGELSTGTFPVIAHMIRRTEHNTKEPHFVVVEHAGSSGVKILDGFGRRGMWSVDSFLEEWDGYMLRVVKPKGGIRKPRFLPRAPKRTPRLQFDTLFLDAGDIPQSEAEHVFTFRFANTGVGDLHIEKIVTGCKCVVVDNQAETISPGETSKISVRYKFGKNRGRFSQTVAVKSNDPYFPLVKLNLVGNGMQEVKTAPSVPSFGNVIAGKRAIARCFITYTGDSVFQIKSAETDTKHLKVNLQPLTPSLMQDLEPQAKGITLDECRNRYVVRGVIDTMGLEPGKTHFAVQMGTNLKDFPQMRLPVSLTVISPVRAEPGRLFLGEIAEGNLIRETIIIKSRTGRQLVVDGVDLDNTGLNWEYARDNLGNIELTFAGRITGQDQIQDHKVIVQLRVLDSEESFIVELPISGLVRKAKRAS